MVGIAIIGCGSITRVRHAPECYTNEKINLCGFYNPNQERCREFAEKYNCKAYKTYEEVMSDSEVDGVIICTPNKLHCEMAVEAFHNGKHVMCEKPVAVTSEEAQFMIDAATKAGKYLMVAHNQRFEPANRKAKEILDSGKLGKIISFRTGFGHSGPEGWSVEKSNATWFFNKEKSGLGAMGDLGIHKADLIRWLINDDIKYVTAQVSTLNKKMPNGEMISLDDNAFCILESASGIVGTLEASWTRYGKGENVTCLYCENGVIEVNPNVVTVKMKGVAQESIKIENTESGMADAFANCILTNTYPELDGNEGKKALDIVLKCIESSELNKRVEV